MPIYDGRARTRLLSPRDDFFEPLLPGKKLPLEWWGFDVAVQPEKSLLINDASVVADPARTYDSCANTGTPLGKWTFGYLMTQLASSGFTGFDPADFTKQWIDNMMAAPVVNGFDAGPQGFFQGPVLDQWPKTSAGKLDLAKAPFKLLAIVNRVDLRKSSVYFHIDARTAALSGFMTGIDVDGHHFNELERRAADLDGLVNSQCLNMLDTKRLVPFTLVH